MPSRWCDRQVLSSAFICYRPLSEWVTEAIHRVRTTSPEALDQACAEMQDVHGLTTSCCRLSLLSSSGSCCAQPRCSTKSAVSVEICGNGCSRKSTRLFESPPWPRPGLGLLTAVRPRRWPPSAKRHIGSNGKKRRRVCRTLRKTVTTQCLRGSARGASRHVCIAGEAHERARSRHCSTSAGDPVSMSFPECQRPQSFRAIGALPVSPDGV